VLFSLAHPSVSPIIVSGIGKPLPDPLLIDRENQQATLFIVTLNELANHIRTTDVLNNQQRVLQHRLIEVHETQNLPTNNLNSPFPSPFTLAPLFYI
jgi:hypothetical protein